MKDKNKISIVVSTLVVASILATTAAFADDFTQEDGQNGYRMGNRRNASISSEVRNKLQDEVEAGNYNNWVELMKKYHPNVPHIMTESEFRNMQKAHEFMKEGKVKEAQALMPEKTWKRGGANGNSKFRRHSVLSKEDRENLFDSVEKGDYKTFSELTRREVTQDEFNKMTQAHKLRNDGKFDEAHELMKNIRPNRTRRGGQMGNGQGMGQTGTGQRMFNNTK